MVKLVQHNDDEIPILNEEWTLHFWSHKSLSFETKEDLEKYLNGECSEKHGFMEYERTPHSVEHTVYYDIDYGVK